MPCHLRCQGAKHVSSVEPGGQDVDGDVRRSDQGVCDGWVVVGLGGCADRPPGAWMWAELDIGGPDAFTCGKGKECADRTDDGSLKLSVCGVGGPPARASRRPCRSLRFRLSRALQGPEGSTRTGGCGVGPLGRDLAARHGLRRGTTWHGRSESGRTSWSSVLAGRRRERIRRDRQVSVVRARSGVRDPWRIEYCSWLIHSLLPP